MTQNNEYTEGAPSHGILFYYGDKIRYGFLCKQKKRNVDIPFDSSRYLNRLADYNGRSMLFEIGTMQNDDTPKRRLPDDFVDLKFYIIKNYPCSYTYFEIILSKITVLLMSYNSKMLTIWNQSWEKVHHKRQTLECLCNHTKIGRNSFAVFSFSWDFCIKIWRFSLKKHCLFAVKGSRVSNRLHYTKSWLLLNSSDRMIFAISYIQNQL